MQIKKLLSLSALSAAAFLGGCVSAPKPIDKIANSRALSDCTVAGLKTVLRAQFKKAEELEQAGQLRAGTSEKFAVVLAEEILSSTGSGAATLIESCMSQVTEVYGDKMPSPQDGKALTEFAARYFDADEFEQKTVSKFPELMNDMIDEAIELRSKRGITTPSDILRKQQKP